MAGTPRSERRHANSAVVGPSDRPQTTHTAAKGASVVSCLCVRSGHGTGCLGMPGAPGAPGAARSACENFLYGFKAARRAARAAATARSPSLPLALPLRRRQRRSAGAKGRRPSGPPLTDSSYWELSRGGLSMLPLRNCPRPGRTRQGRL